MTINKEELRRLAESATPGPWNATNYSHDDGSDWWFVDTSHARADIFDDGGDPAPNHYDCERGERNMKFIAEANPSTILALLDELEAAQEDAGRYRWLRSRGQQCPTIGPDLAYWSDHAGDALRFEQADEAIDAAMQEQKP